MPQEVGSPRLVRIARSHERREMQEQAIFWLGQQGGEDALALFDEIIAGEAEVDVQKKVVFAFSQMSKDLGVPRLITVAKGHPSDEVRKQAVFWLGQANDDRAREALVELVQSQ